MIQEYERKTNSEKERSSTVVKCLFLILLFLAPLNKGMVFEEQFWFPAMFIAWLLFYVLKNQGQKIKFSLPVFLLLLLCLSYFLSFLRAVSPHLAYVGFLKYIFYFAACFLATHLWRGEDEGKQHILLAMVGAVTVATIYTFLVQAHFLKPPFYFSKERFFSVFQYPNTYAIMLAVSIIFIVYLFSVSTKKWGKVLLLTAWFFNTVAFYAAVSRGAALVYAPALLFLLFSLEKKDRRQTLGNIILINALALISASFILQNPGVKTIFVLFLGLLPILFVNLLLEKEVLSPSLGAGLIIVLFLAGGLLLVRYFPEKAVLSPLTRLTEINLETKAVGARFYLYVDALKLIQKHWLIGTGAASWEVLYRTIQGHRYDSSEVHNSVLQTMVESGIIGTVFFLGIFGFILGQQIWRRKKQKNTVFTRIVFLAILVLFLHSFIDIDLSYAAVSMYFFVLVGLLGSEYSFPPAYSKVLRRISWVLVSVLFFSVTSMGSAYFLSQRTVATIKTNRIAEVALVPQHEYNLALAQELSPLKSFYSSYLGLIKIAQGVQQGIPVKIEEGLECLERAIEVSPWQCEAYLTKGLMLVELQRGEEAIPYFEKMITLGPMQTSGYAYAIKNYAHLALGTGQGKYLGLTRQVYSRAEAQMQKVEPERLPYWEYEKLDEDALINFYAGIAEYLAGDYIQAENYFYRALAEATAVLLEETKAWIVVTQETRGIKVAEVAKPEEVKFVRSILQKYRTKVEERNGCLPK
ncbi:MAG: O-antigen ligase family protein [Clostridia bacterium]|nr:O-antigen ligase family protein [Clostridia bacterium]